MPIPFWNIPVFGQHYRTEEACFLSAMIVICYLGQLSWKRGSISVKTELMSNVYVTRMWENLQGYALFNGEGLLKTIINYWIEIRMRALVKLLLDKRRQEIRTEKREKGLGKKLQKKK